MWYSRFIITILIFSSCFPFATGQQCAPPVLTNNPSPACESDDVTIIISGLTYAKFDWSITEPNGSNYALTTFTDAGTETNIVIQDVEAGNYVINVTQEKSGTCDLSDPLTINLTVHGFPAAPTVGIISQPTCIIPTGSVMLNGLPQFEQWTITVSPGGTTYVGTGMSYNVQGLSPNDTYTFTVTNSFGCTSPPTNGVTINPIPPDPELGGAISVCSGFQATVTPTSGGTWTSSDPSVATVTNAGSVTGIIAGSVTLTYTRTSDGCSNSKFFTVYNTPNAPIIGSITQPTCTIQTGSVVLNGLPSSGNWTITQFPGGLTNSGSGTTYTWINLPPNNTYSFSVTNSDNCNSPLSANVIINDLPPSPILGGDDQACVGENANVTPDSGGTWNSSNTSIATVTNSGQVSAISQGVSTLTYIRTSDGCQDSMAFTVYNIPAAPEIGQVTQPDCDMPLGSVQLTGLPTPGMYTIKSFPIEMAYSGSGATFTVSGLFPGVTYHFTVTLNNCESQNSENVDISDIPDSPILVGDDDVCEGQIAYVTPGSDGTWISSDASIATVTNNGVVSGISPGNVTLTYTRTSDGCSNSKPFTVFYTPNAPIIGTITQPTCIDTTGRVVLSGLPASGWTLTRYPGEIPHEGSGTSFTWDELPKDNTYYFKVTNIDGCTSPSSADVVINGIPSPPTLGGDNQACVGGIAYVTPNSAGIWESSNGLIATVSDAGVVTGISPGTVILTYTRSFDGCTNTKGFIVYPNPSPPQIGSIIHPTCIIPTGSVMLNGLPASGSWIITRYPGGIAYAGTGISFTVTGLPPGTTYTFSVQNSNNCSSVNSANAVVNPIPTDPVLGGDNSVCEGLTAMVTPGSAGYWQSGNSSIASVTNAGIVTGNSAGNVALTYTRAIDGCFSSLTFTVHPTPVIGINGPDVICEREEQFLSATGSLGEYVWSIDGQEQSGNSIDLSYLSDGNYNVYLTITDNNSCTNIVEKNLEVKNVPVLEMTITSGVDEGVMVFTPILQGGNSTEVESIHHIILRKDSQIEVYDQIAFEINSFEVLLVSGIEYVLKSNILYKNNCSENLEIEFTVNPSDCKLYVLTAILDNEESEISNSLKKINFCGNKVEAFKIKFYRQGLSKVDFSFNNKTITGVGNNTIIINIGVQDLIYGENLVSGKVIYYFQGSDLECDISFIINAQPKPYLKLKEDQFCYENNSLSLVVEANTPGTSFQYNNTVYSDQKVNVNISNKDSIYHIIFKEIKAVNNICAAYLDTLEYHVFRTPVINIMDDLCKDDTLRQLVLLDMLDKMEWFTITNSNGDTIDVNQSGLELGETTMISVNASRKIELSDTLVCKAGPISKEIKINQLPDAVIGGYDNDCGPFYKAEQLGQGINSDVDIGWKLNNAGGGIHPILGDQIVAISGTGNLVLTLKSPEGCYDHDTIQISGNGLFEFDEQTLIQYRVCNDSSLYYIDNFNGNDCFRWFYIDGDQIHQVEGIDQKPYKKLKTTSIPLLVKYPCGTSCGGTIISKRSATPVHDCNETSQNKNEPWSVFPVPVTDFLTLRSDHFVAGSYRIIVFDDLGRQRLTLKHEHEGGPLIRLVDILELNAGMYFISINEETKKFIVIK